MNVESELKSIINRLYDIQDVSGPDLSKKIYEIILQCREAIGYRKAELDRVQSSRKPIKSADKHFNYDEYLGDIYDSDKSNADFWSREDYNEMVETARGIFYPAVQKAANACHFTVSDNEAEYVAEKCVRCFFDNSSWDEAVNRPEEYYVNSSRKPIKSVRVIEAPNDFNEYNATAKDCIRYELDGTPFSKFLDDDFCKRVIDNIVGNYEVSETEVKDAIDYYKRQAKAEQVNSSRKSIKSSLEDVLHEYRKYGAYMPGSYIEQLISTMYNLLPEDGKLKVDDFIHGDWDPLEGKMVPRNTVKSSTIKSSLEDRLVPYLEEFEEGFADTQVVAPGDEMDIPSRQETFFEIFKNDYNLSDEDINKLKDAVMSIWEATAGN